MILLDEICHILDSKNISYELKYNGNSVVLADNFVIMICNNDHISFNTFGYHNAMERIAKLINCGYMMETSYETIYKKIETMDELIEHMTIGLSIRDA